MKTVQFAFAFLFLWFLTAVFTGQIWLWPVVFVGLVVWVVYRTSLGPRGPKLVQKASGSVNPQAPDAQLAIAETNARRQADRAIATAEAGYGSLLTNEAIRMLCVTRINPHQGRSRPLRWRAARGCGTLRLSPQALD